MDIEGLFPEQDSTPEEGASSFSFSQQTENASKFDLPVPGQSLTSEPGSAAYEQPPQYNTVADAAEYLFNQITIQVNTTNVLRMLAAGAPVYSLVTPMLLHGAQEGFWNMDMILPLVEPLATIIIGLGQLAGIDVNYKHEPRVKMVDTEKFRKLLKGSTVGSKQSTASRKAELLASIKPVSKGILSKPKGVK